MTLPSPAALERAKASLGELSSAPLIGIVLGSGLGDFAKRLTDARIVPYDKIDGMPHTRVVGHAGELHLGTLGGVSVACLRGRAHAYEGHELSSVCFGVTLLATLGCRAVLLSNAAGGVNPAFSPGDLMLISDHLNLTGQNPLLGPEDPRSPRFVDLSHAYDPRLCALARQAAASRGIQLREGVYAAMLGPSYETPAEIRMLAQLGASAVGMSTALEVIALRALNVDVGAVSCITNLAAGLSGAPITHEEVQVTANQAKARFEGLVEGWVELAAGLYL